MDRKIDENELHKVFSEDLLGILLHDVLQSMQRRTASDTQALRRDLIRTMFAAIEGASWEFRTRVRSAAIELDGLTPIIEMALSEKTYFVTESGEIAEQTRYISLPAMIRLTTRLAENICPGFKFDFRNDGWSNFKLSIQIRHRITHPKNIIELKITDEEITTAESAFYWILNLTQYISEVTLLELSHHTKTMRKVVDDLIAGDPKTLALYQAAINSDE